MLYNSTGCYPPFHQPPQGRPVSVGRRSSDRKLYETGSTIDFQYMPPNTFPPTKYAILMSIRNGKARSMFKLEVTHALLGSHIAQF
jgi:hypothetical protein